MGGFDSYAFQIRMHFGFVPFDAAFADALQRAILAGAPQWAAMARVSRAGDRTVSERFQASRPGTLRSTIAANHRGGTGAVVLTGADRGASIVLDFLGATSIDSLLVETTQREIDGVPAGVWVERVFRAFCAELHPRAARASSMSERGAAARYGASGEIEWLTFYGATRARAIDIAALLAIPGVDIEEIADGVLIRVDPSPDPRRLKPFWLKVNAIEDVVGGTAPDLRRARRG